MMIRSSRIPEILKKAVTVPGVIQTALLVTTDGELLGSTASTFLSTSTSSTSTTTTTTTTTKESIDSLGTLIADIA